MIKKKMLLASCTFILALAASGQDNESKKANIREFAPSSPVAAMFNIFGTIPVSHFTGTPDVTIPLGGVSYKELGVNLNLKYHHAVGAKPEATPGYYGNGWLLTTGGVITRLSKGVRTADIAGEDPVPVETVDPRSHDDWSSATRMQNHLSTAAIFDDAGGRYDEFSFEFLGHSGKFYTDHEGKIRVKTKEGEDFLVEVQAMSNKGFQLPAEPQLSRRQFNWDIHYNGGVINQQQFIYKFTFTDSKGIKYIFGGHDASIDFARIGMGPSAYDVSNENTLPASWHLTAIESPNGYKIEYEYERGFFYVTSQSYVRGLTFTHSKISPTWIGEQPIKRIKSNLYNPCYLKKIKTPVSVVEFYWSKADKQLSYFYVPFNPEWSREYNLTAPNPDGDNPAYFCHYPDVANADLEKRFSNKLDGFAIFDLQNNQHSRVSFVYTEDINTRLKLTSVQINGPSGKVENALVYSFGYNQISLPNYRSFKIDKFGFYNNGPNYMTELGPDHYTSLFNNATTRLQYLQSREPNPAYTKAEVLEKVTYPTGGYTIYEYENNQYGSYASFWPNAVAPNANGSILYAGGLRIKSIRNFDGLGGMMASKTYYYCKNYPSTAVSSGVLSYMPEFYRRFSGFTNAPASTPLQKYAGDILYIHYGSDPINPQSYNKGSSITYSEVAEVDENGGYKVFSYKNYDNGYHDNPAERMVSDNANVAEFWKEDDTNLMDNERGQLLWEKVYNSQSDPIKKTTYKYNSIPSRFDKHVRILKSYPNDIYGLSFRSIRYIATLQYTYYPYLESKEDEIFTENGESIVTTTNYSYDDEYKVLKESTIKGSNNKTQTLQLQYPFDEVQAGNTIPYQEMVQRHMFSLPVSQETIIDGNLLHKDVTTYAKGLSHDQQLILPHKEQRVYPGNDVVTKQVIHEYDNIGNPLWVTNAQGVHASYLYGYNRLHPIAEVVNSEYSTVSSVLGGQAAITTFSLKSNPSESEVNTFLAPLRNSSVLQASYISTFISDPLKGLLSKTDANGVRTYYEYDYLSRLHLIRDNDRNIVKMIGYKYFNQPEPFKGFRSRPVSKVFRKSDCAPMHIGSTVVVSLPEGTKFSFKDEDDATDKVMQYLNSYGQAYADNSDESGTTCTPYNGPLYAKPRFENIETDENGNKYANVIVEFYTDPLYTIPITIDNRTLYYSIMPNCPGLNQVKGSVQVSGRSQLVLQAIPYLVTSQGAPECTLVWVEGEGWVEECSEPQPATCAPLWDFSFTPPADPQEPLEPGVFKIGSVYAKFTKDLNTVETDNTGGVWCDVHVTFYANAACTIPATVSNLPIDYAFKDGCGQMDLPAGTITANGGSYIFYSHLVSYPNGLSECTVTLDLYNH